MFPFVSPNQPLDQQPSVSLPRTSDFPAFRLALAGSPLHPPRQPFHSASRFIWHPLHSTSASFRLFFLPRGEVFAPRSPFPRAVSARLPLRSSPRGTLPPTLWIAKSCLVSLDSPRGVANEPTALRYSDHILSAILNFMDTEEPSLISSRESRRRRGVSETYRTLKKFLPADRECIFARFAKRFTANFPPSLGARVQRGKARKIS